jgi:hypothetical protein
VSSVALDHLIVACATLEQGAAWCEATLGAAPVAGGKHALMGTHNRLLQLSSEAWPRLYLELIAIDPQAPAPAHPRWFGLDAPALQARLAERGPVLIHAVARSTMLDMHRWGLITIGHTPGDPVDLVRGDYRWQMLVRRDGGLDNGGALPTLLQWQGPHPADALPASGVSLKSLTLAGVGERVRQLLRLRGVQLDADAAAPALRALLTTPRGEVILESDRP